MTVFGFKSATRACWRGLTLMEMLVVLTLVSLLGTSLVQALGFFADRYQSVTRSHRVADVGTMQQRWFETTVAGIVPVGVYERAFRGDPSGFVATTLQPLAAEPGLPTVARWAIAAEQPAVLLYAEGNAATEERAKAWRLPMPAQGQLSFQYADRRGVWHNEWSFAVAPGEWTPRLVRLVVDDETLWVAGVDASPFPLPNEGQSW